MKMQKAIISLSLVLLLLPIVSALNINFRGRTSTDCSVAEGKAISRLNFQFILNDETKFKPVSMGRASLTVNYKDGDRLSVNFGKLTSYEIDGDFVNAHFDKAVIKYVTKECRPEWKKCKFVTYWIKEKITVYYDTVFDASYIRSSLFCNIDN